MVSPFVLSLTAIARDSFWETHSARLQRSQVLKVRDGSLFNSPLITHSASVAPVSSSKPFANLFIL